MNALRFLLQLSTRRVGQRYKGEFIIVLPITASETLKRFHPGSYCIFNLRKTKTGMTVGMEIQGWEDGEIVDIPV